MRDRLELLRRLLTDDGSIWITIDDNEAHYLKVLCDEVFGRRTSLATCGLAEDDMRVKNRTTSFRRSRLHSASLRRTAITWRRRATC